MHQKAFGGRAASGPAEEVNTSQTFSALRVTEGEEEVMRLTQTTLFALLREP